MTSRSPARGAATVTTGGGDLSASGASGVLTFSTGGGDVDGSGLLSPNVDVDSGGGDVALTFTRVAGARLRRQQRGRHHHRAAARRDPVRDHGRAPHGGDYQRSFGAKDNLAAANKITVNSGGGDVNITEAP